jgi:hypothetical protein
MKLPEPLYRHKHDQETVAKLEQFDSTVLHGPGSKANRAHENDHHQNITVHADTNELVHVNIRCVRVAFGAGKPLGSGACHCSYNDLIQPIYLRRPHT